MSHEGELWVRWADRPSAAFARWTVYAADRGEMRRVLLPRIEVQSVRAGRIYGHTESALGIQSIVVIDVPGSG